MSEARTTESVAAIVKAYDVRGLVGEQIDEQFVADVGRAFAGLMRGEGATRVVIGHDMRDSSPTLSAAFAGGVCEQGLDVVLIGLAATDQLYFASGLLQAPGAMFTASHNPAAYNGIKLCRSGAKPVGQATGLATIAEQLVAGTPPWEGPRGTVTTHDLLADYCAHLSTLVDITAGRALTVAVDAGNGMGGHTVPAMFDTNPLITIKPLYFELDGTFPNHEANPLDPANLVDLQEFVRTAGADIGLAFDGDADRCFVVDETGAPVSPSAVTAMVARRELAKNPGASIIHNLITSRAVPELISELGGIAVRTRVGHSFIKQQMAETGAVFGGEHSAHYYFREFWGADSGMLAALHVLATLMESDEPASQIFARYERYASSGEINSTVADAGAATDAVVADFDGETESVDHLDGVTVRLADGAWFNLRASNTEPLLRLNAEASSRERVDRLVDRILAIVRA